MILKATDSGEDRPVPQAQTQSPSSYLDALRAGTPISREQACALIRVSDADLPALLAGALAAKQRFKPDVITYSRKVFIPLTNLCRDYCGYCTFRRDPGDPGDPDVTPGVRL